MMRLALIACLWLAATTAGADEISLSSESRKSLAVAIYNDGHGLIWDRRAALLVSGINRVAFGEVSRQMLPSSVMIMSEAGVRLVDFTFDSTLLTQQALLRHFVGKTVGLVRMHPTTGEETVETANLLSVAEKPIVNHRGRIEAVDPGRLVFNEAPQHLRPQPTLVATMECGESGRRDISLGYSTRGLSWSADYIALWNEQAKQLELTGRAALSNTSGAGFPEAELSLIAGSVNREEDPQMPPVAFARIAPMMAEPKSILTREPFADRHLYKVPGRVSLDDQQIKQIVLFPPTLLPVEREYVSEGGIAMDRQTGEPRATHPHVRLNFRNAPRAKAGRPMPAGIVRVYAEGEAAPPWLVGEDRIEHTPEGERVSLNLGEAFDVSVLRRQTDFARSGLPEGVSESAWAIEARNASDQPAMIRLVEVVPGDWTILAESAPHEKETANRLVWRLQVPANGVAQLTYRVRVQQ